MSQSSRIEKERKQRVVGGFGLEADDLFCLSVAQDSIDGVSFAYSFDDAKAKGRLLTQ